MGFPTDFFPVLFAIPRVAGWLAHWNESLQDKNGKIWRPRQVHTSANNLANKRARTNVRTNEQTRNACEECEHAVVEMSGPGPRPWTPPLP